MEVSANTLTAELFLELTDNEWPFDYIDHDRSIARAIVFDDECFLYFAHISRDDDFGKSELIETSGGGVEPNEDLHAAIKRELKEELGCEVEVISKIGVVSDFYNLIHRHNINNYFLCRAVSFGDRQLTEDEINCFHLTILRLSFADAFAEYESCACTPLGRLIARRELPVLKRAKEIFDSINCQN